MTSLQSEISIRGPQWTPVCCCHTGQLPRATTLAVVAITFKPLMDVKSSATPSGSLAVAWSASSLADSAPAIDEENLARHERAGRREEKDGGADDVLRRAEPAHRDAGERGTALALVCEDRL